MIDQLDRGVLALAAIPVTSVVVATTAARLLLRAVGGGERP